MNDYRTELIERVFIILDRDDDGLVDFNDIKASYNSKRHPEVMQGKRSQEAVYNDFIETFEDHHQLFTGVTTSKSSSISIEEFFSYYTNVSTFYENDEQFAILLSNVWSASGQN